MSKLFSRFNLQFMFIKNIYLSFFFLIMKILTNFSKTVETGIDPRLLGTDYLAFEGGGYKI